MVRGNPELSFSLKGRAAVMGEPRELRRGVDAETGIRA